MLYLLQRPVMHCSITPHCDFSHSGHQLPVHNYRQRPGVWGWREYWLWDGVRPHGLRFSWLQLPLQTWQPHHRASRCAALCCEGGSKLLIISRCHKLDPCFNQGVIGLNLFNLNVEWKMYNFTLKFLTRKICFSLFVVWWGPTRGPEMNVDFRETENRMQKIHYGPWMMINTSSFRLLCCQSDGDFT